MATKKFKISYWAPICGSHYVSVGKLSLKNRELLETRGTVTNVTELCRVTQM